MKANAQLIGHAPARYFFLTIEHGRVVVKYDGTSGGEVTRVVHSTADFANFIQSKAREAGCSWADLSIMGSSSIDFPEEYTDNADTIALANKFG